MSELSKKFEGKLLNAEEARELTQDSLRDRSNSQLQEICDHIRLRAEEGKYFTSVEIKDTAAWHYSKETLKKLNFTISDLANYSGRMYATVYWTEN